MSSRHPRVWVYEKDKNPRHARVQEIAHQRDFYSFFRDGVRDDSYDKLFLQRIESEVPKVLAFAHDGKVGSTERKAIADFVGVMSARVPIARDHADELIGESATARLAPYRDDPEQFARAFTALQPQLEDQVSAEEARALMKKGYRLKQSSVQFNLTMMLQMARQNRDCLLDMTWAVWLAPDDDHFVTSDNPVVSVLPDTGGRGTTGVNFGNPKAQVLLAITPARLFVASRNVRPGCHAISRRGVHLVNKMIMAMADRFVYASEHSQRLSAVYNKMAGTGSLQRDFYQPVWRDRSAQ